jgi:glycopeptide antibiotics resistance protein
LNWLGLIQYYLNEYVLLSGMLAWLFLLVIFKWRGRSWTYLGFFTLFWLYLVVLVSAVVFSGIYFRADNWASRLEAAPLVLARVNLVPFGGYYSLTPHANSEMIFNLLMTVPLGFGLNFLTAVRFKRIVLVALLVGLGFEMGQLALTLYAASPTRGIDITDVLLNGLGVLFGYGLFRLLAWLYVSALKAMQVEPHGILAFLYQTALNSRTAK